jgi:hypothetical protein
VLGKDTSADQALDGSGEAAALSSGSWLLICLPGGSVLLVDSNARSIRHICPPGWKGQCGVLDPTPPSAGACWWCAGHAMVALALVKLCVATLSFCRECFLVLRMMNFRSWLKFLIDWCFFQFVLDPMSLVWLLAGGPVALLW